MKISLDGQTVVVTGGAKRLGRAIATECAASGANVAISYNTSGQAAEELVGKLRAEHPGQEFDAHPLEVSDPGSVREFYAAVLERFGAVQGLVNCAAIFRRTPFDVMNEADFDDHIAANLKGPYLLCKAFGDHFLTGGGSIVNFADIYGTRPLANYIPYCVSKAGVIMLTQGLAKALAPRVRVNCICPGTILPPSQTQGEADQEEELVRRVPMGRLGSPEEIAQTVVFLLGGPQFITGAILPVDGAQNLR